MDVVTDLATLKPRLENVADMIQFASVSPTGRRAAFQARGDVFTVPAEHGVVRNLTRTPGVAERSPMWSPDGRHVAYWSDRTGEYELTIQASDGSGEERTLTSLGAGFRYTPYWSPDSKRVAFMDHAGSPQGPRPRRWNNEPGSEVGRVGRPRAGERFLGELVAGQPVAGLFPGDGRGRVLHPLARHGLGGGAPGHVGVLRRLAANLRSRREVPVPADQPAPGARLRRHRRHVDLSQLHADRRNRADAGRCLAARSPRNDEEESEDASF